MVSHGNGPSGPQKLRCTYKSLDPENGRRGRDAFVPIGDGRMYVSVGARGFSDERLRCIRGRAA
jgi:hypothetical protein